MPTDSADLNLDASEAYFYDVLDGMPKRDKASEVRRVFATILVLEYLNPIAERVVPLANDIEAYLRAGVVPGRGVAQVTIMAHDSETGKVIR